MVFFPLTMVTTTVAGVEIHLFPYEIYRTSVYNIIMCVLRSERFFFLSLFLCVRIFETGECVRRHAARVEFFAACRVSKRHENLDGGCEETDSLNNNYYFFKLYVRVRVRKNFGCIIIIIRVNEFLVSCVLRIVISD